MRTGILLLVYVLAGFIFSCNTKVDLIEDGVESAVVYGFLDPNLDTQFVKIIHTFLTDGNAFDAAQIQEISEYKDLEAYVIVYNGSDSINAYLLQEKTVTDKDSGVFYYPVQTIYYFTEPINHDLSYELKFFGSGNEVSSKTAIVGDFNANNTLLSPIISLVLEFDVSGSTYRSRLIRIESAKNVRRYEVRLRFHYSEVYTDGTIIEKYLDFKNAPIETETLSGGETYDVFIAGESFYRRVAGRILGQSNEVNVAKRIIGNLDHIIEYAGEDLNIFLELNEPFTSFTPEKNPFTNIVNGIGVWSSRGRMVFEGKSLNISSIRELTSGQFTGDLKFCSDDPSHDGTSWGCN